MEASPQILSFTQVLEESVMTLRTLSGLVLAAALSLPAFAQDTTNSTPASSTDQPAATQQQQPSQDQSATTTSSSDQAAQADRKPLEYQRREGFWGKMNPFARKKYLRRQLDPVRDRVNELDELTSQNAKQIKDVDTRASEGIRQASLKANEADQHAVEAGSRAQLAHNTASQATQRLQTVEHVVGNIDQFQLATQAEIRFRPGQVGLSKRAKDALDELATPLKEQKGYVVEVQGFSSGRGQAAIENSQRMAQSVVRYLVLEHEIPVYRVFVLGLGNAPVQGSAEGKPRRTSGGRVEISLLKNGIGDLDTQPIQAGGNLANSGSGESAPSSSALPQSDQPAANAPAGSTSGQQPASTQPTGEQPPATKPEPQSQEPPKN
jgi:outer membrane protein OmpA-like peptidoglycan-associated protein